MKDQNIHGENLSVGKKYHRRGVIVPPNLEMCTSMGNEECMHGHMRARAQALRPYQVFCTHFIPIRSAYAHPRTDEEAHRY